VNEAEASLLASITQLPEFTSIVLEIVTDTQAFNALTQLLGPLPTGTQGEAELNSIFSQLPPDAQSFFSSLTAEEALIVSSIVNAGSPASGSSATATGPASAGATTTSKTASNNAVQSTSSMMTSQSNFTGSALTTLTSSTRATNSSSASVAVVTENAGDLLRSGGVGFVLAILGAGIAAL